MTRKAKHLFSTLCRAQEQLSKFNFIWLLCTFAVVTVAYVVFTGNFNDARNADSITDPAKITIAEKSAEAIISEKTAVIESKTDKKSRYTLTCCFMPP